MASLVTYRDDHDAALQRAAALEAELERAKAERDAATRERDRLAVELAAEHDRPEQRIVVVPKEPLTRAERDALVGALARGVRGYRTRSWLGVMLGVGFGIGSIALGTAVGVLSFCAAAVMTVSALAQLWRSTADRWRPVLAAVRDAPGDVIAIRRLDSGRGWWLLVETRTGELHMRGDAAVIRLLERHCPGARFDG